MPQAEREEKIKKMDENLNQYDGNYNNGGNNPNRGPDNPNGQGGPGGNGNDPKKQSLIILAIAALITLFSISMFMKFMTGSNNQEISYNEFIEMMEKGEIKSVVVDSDRITIQPRQTESNNPFLYVYGGGTTYYTGKMEDDDTLTARLLEHDIVIKKQVADSSSVIITILSVLLRENVCALFGSDAATTEYVVQIYPMFSLGFIVMAINVMISAYLYSTERSALSTGISLLRSVVLNSAIILILPRIFGDGAIWLSMFTYETIVLVIAAVLLKHSERNGIQFK